MTSTHSPIERHRLLLLREVADQRGVSYFKTYEDVRAGRLSAVRVGIGRDAFRVLSPDVGAAIDLLPEDAPVTDVAEFLRINLSSLWKLVKADRFPSPTIRRDDLKAFVLGAVCPNPPLSPES